MTRKDFELIAAAFREARRNIEDKEPADAVERLNDGVSYAADYLADALAKTNERFDRARFRAACGCGV